MENIRTNYFRVTNEERYKELFGKLVSPRKLQIWDYTRSDINGVVWHGFGSHDMVECIDENGNRDNDIFYKGLQEILPHDEAFILIENDLEAKLRHIAGFATVVTKDIIKYVDITDEALKLARDTINDSEWNNQNIPTNVLYFPETTIDH